MIDAPSVATEMARNAPLTAGALYLSFISQYGGAVVTSFAIIYAIMQMVLRWKEHRALMNKHKEPRNGRKRR